MKILLLLSLVICYFSGSSQDVGTLTDVRDGKVYKTVKIGEQWWMAENLSYKADSGCWAYKNAEINVPKYGRLYDWKTATNACPDGWHLPSSKEWNILTDYLGGDEVAGGKLKATTSWESPNSYATNEFGFNALPVGYRGFGGSSFTLFGRVAYFWTSTQLESGNAHGRSMNYDSGEVTREYYGSYPTDGYSVRCLKN